MAKSIATRLGQEGHNWTQTEWRALAEALQALVEGRSDKYDEFRKQHPIEENKECLQ